MSKKRIAILTAVCAVVVLLVAGVLIWFFSPGVHFLGNFANFDLEEEKCYIISKDSGEVLGQTTLTLKGFVNNPSEGTVSGGTFEIRGYTDILHGQRGQLIDDLVAAKHNGEWTVLYSAYENFEGDILPSEAESAAGVNVQIWFVEDVPVAWVAYGKEWKQQDVYAVCADSEEAALAVYQEYIGE